MIMKRSEIEDLILGHDQGQGGHINASHTSTPGLRLDVDPEEKGLIMVQYAASEREWVSILVLDGSGTIHVQREKRSKKGNNCFQLDLRHLPEGTYRLRILTSQSLLSGTIHL